MNLFTPIVPPDRYHPNFRAAISAFGAEERTVISSWAEDFVDRDNKLVREFQTTFNSSFWELYLHAVFRRLGFVVDWSQPSPDFALQKGDVRFNVEATTANAAQGKPNEWDRDLSVESVLAMSIPDINREATIRLSNAITAKHRKYRESYRKLAHVGGRPFVIAVAPFEQPFFNLQYDRPIRCLLYDYYVDEAAYEKDPAKYPAGPPGVSLGTLTKDTGTEIELGFFKSDIMEEVSAVIFSCVASWGKANALSPGDPKSSRFNYVRLDDHGRPVAHSLVRKADYHESLEDGLQVYHNPFAKWPLDPSLFRADGIVQHFYDHANDDWVYEGIPHALTWRQVISHSVSGSEAGPVGAATEPSAPTGPT